MELFIVKEDGFTIDINPILYTIGEFANLIEFRTNDKKLLKKELAYIYFHSDLKSDFQFQVDANQRKRDLIKFLNLDPSWSVVPELQAAIDAYKYLSQTVSSKLLATVYSIVDKIEAQLNSIDLDERDKSNKPIWNIKQIQEVAQRLPYVMESIDKAEKIYIKAQEDNTKIRGAKTKSLYEDDL